MRVAKEHREDFVILVGVLSHEYLRDQQVNQQTANHAHHDFGGK
jgi:hypothetical protein